LSSSEISSRHAGGLASVIILKLIVKFIRQISGWPALASPFVAQRVRAIQT
jgi:hypothetical protein